ncbi:MAG: VWA domain-containing protein [Succinivibrionaceae bacterium]
MVFTGRFLLLWLCCLFCSIPVMANEDVKDEKVIKTDEVIMIEEFKEKTAESKPQRVELIMILDESGSMYKLVSDTIGGFNSMIDKQRKSGIPSQVTTVLFNEKTDILYLQKPLDEIPELTNNEYSPERSTALLDAVGNTIRTVDGFKGISDKGTQVMVVIITDGMENSSREYSYALVKNLISERQDKNGWKFIFLGANIDAPRVAQDLGIDPDHAVKYKNTSSGVKANFDAVANYAKSVADGEEDPQEWKDLVEKDE